MEWIKKYWFLIVFVLGAIGGFIKWLSTVDGRLFSSPDSKVKVESYVKEAPSVRELLFDSINKAHAVKSRMFRDSLLQTTLEQMKKEMKVRDSLRKLDADQIYQMKEEVKMMRIEQHNNNRRSN